MVRSAMTAMAAVTRMTGLIVFLVFGVLVGGVVVRGIVQTGFVVEAAQSAA